MNDSTTKNDFRKEKESTWSMLEQIAREGARTMLQVALESEINEFVEKHKDDTDEHGRRRVVKNGYMPEREIITGIGPINIKQPRIDDRKLNEKQNGERFTSEILPRYLRRIPSIDNLVPFLYLKGISTNDFPKALTAILGEGALYVNIVDVWFFEKNHAAHLIFCRVSREGFK
jgi:putative transposase